MDFVLCLFLRWVLLALCLGGSVFTIAGNFGCWFSGFLGRVRAVVGGGVGEMLVMGGGGLE